MENNKTYIMSFFRDCGYDGYTYMNMCVSNDLEKLENYKKSYLEEYKSFKKDVINLLEEKKEMIESNQKNNPGICILNPDIKQKIEEKYKEIISKYPTLNKFVPNVKGLSEEMMSSHQSDSCYQEFEIQIEEILNA